MTSKRKTWNGILNKKEREHLRENKIRYKYQMIEQVRFLKENDRTGIHFCFECRSIAMKLGMWDMVID